MVEKTLKFVSVDKAMPEKRQAEERAADFAEIYKDYVTDAATVQASRCSQCGVPFCQVHCPLQNNIPDWLRLTAEGRYQEAYELAAATNNMPEVCGRICPQDRLCEGNCVIEKDFGSVTIGSVEKFLTDLAWQEGWVKPVTVRQERDQSIGIIGAGPGGLAAAEMLRSRGYKVHVYDRYDRIGGLLIYGIPNFKLEKDVVARRAERLKEAGIKFHLGVNVGEDLSFDDLRSRHDAVLVATGTYKARDIQAPGVGLKGIKPALDYLIASNRQGLGDRVPEIEDGSLNAQARRVVVIGGGDTAMDCVRTAIRQGAKEVTCLYRRDRANMPGSAREVHHAEEEGVTFRWLNAPEAFTGGDQVTGVRAHKIRLGAPDSSGRQRPEQVPDSTETIEADLVIKALGYEPEDLPVLFHEPKLETTRWGTIRIDSETKMTSLDGVFAVGDVVRGASLVVWAIRDGREAAQSIHHFLQRAAAGQSANDMALAS